MFEISDTVKTNFANEHVFTCYVLADAIIHLLALKSIRLYFHSNMTKDKWRQCLETSCFCVCIFQYC